VGILTSFEKRSTVWNFLHFIFQRKYNFGGFAQADGAHTQEIRQLRKVVICSKYRYSISARTWRSYSPSSVLEFSFVE